MKQVQINVHALEDAMRLVAGTVGAQLIDATYKAIDAAEQRGAAGLADARAVLLAMDAELNAKLQDAYDEGYDDGYPDGFQDGADACEESDQYREHLEMACAALDDELDRPKINARVEGADWDDLLDDTHYDIFHQRFHRPGDDT